MTQSSEPAYRRPGAAARRLNRTMGWLARHGLGLAGAAELTVLGRRSGEPRRVPVNPMEHEGVHYLVSARGETEWVRNIRVAGGGELRTGRRVRRFTVQEVPPQETVPLLRAYLTRWGWEVKPLFGGLDATADDEQLLAAAPDHPVFRLTPIAG
ncbi:nitroreductase family deazaflavin-dependent oxidoreductase [Streptomyces sp. NPDC059740]|uniref:nitroreductase family deazaflavin-dependent oxidoreductase n=1 Tax=Streptomyces sp. NPDC059740 TaxID=3346926 RepID=UPI00365CB129